MPMQFHVDDLKGPEIAAFLQEHLNDMRAESPPESKHALDLAGLRKPEITFWSVWVDGRLIACCALKELSPSDGELKSMRVAKDLRGEGVGGALVEHLKAEARLRGYSRLWLETGAMRFFEPAHRLYLRHGFERCEAFGSYRPDKNSVFMTHKLLP